MQKELVEAVLRSPGTVGALLEALRALPADVDPTLAVFRAMQALAPTTPFIEAARAFPQPVVAKFIEHVPRATNRDAQAVFLAEAVRGAGEQDLAASWLRALSAFEELGRYEGTIEPRRRRSRAPVLMRDPVFRAGVQAAVASDAANQTRGLIELLAADGSEDSVDALMVELARAETAAGMRLRQLMSVLEVGARTPRMDEMRAGLRQRHAAP